MPFLFAIQQASEGALWMILERAPWHNSPTAVAQAFLFFALFLWPAYVPFAFLPLETDPARARALRGFAAAGVSLGLYLMGVSVFRWSSSCIAFGNIYYAVHVDTEIKRILPFAYVAVVAGPMIVSSVRRTSLLAAATLGSFAVAGLLFKTGFASVWCFFAAVLSGIVALIAHPLRTLSERATDERAVASGG